MRPYWHRTTQITDARAPSHPIPAACTAPHLPLRAFIATECKSRGNQVLRFRLEGLGLGFNLPPQKRSPCPCLYHQSPPPAASAPFPFHKLATGIARAGSAQVAHVISALRRACATTHECNAAAAVHCSGERQQTIAVTFVRKGQMQRRDAKAEEEEKKEEEEATREGDDEAERQVLQGQR